MRLKELLQFGIIELKRSGVTEASTDARLLLEHCLEKSRTEIFLLEDSIVDPHSHNHYLHLIDRRKKREPVCYILGQCEFWSLPFYVTPDVLIPRPETEFLIDRVLSLTKKTNFTAGKILDLCCGSGVIAVVLARETGERVTAIDISAGALDVAKLNIFRNEVGSEVELIQADLFTALLEKRRYSLIVSNPPYVSNFDVENSLAPEVAWFEPHLALDGGEKGMEIIQRIRNWLPFFLTPGGEVFIEIGADQGRRTRDLFEERSDSLPDFCSVEILSDYAGRDRVLHAKLAE